MNVHGPKEDAGAAVAVRQPNPVQTLALGPTMNPRTYHASIPGYGPTPLRRARRTADRLDVARVSVKDESQRLGLPSFKVLGASWAIYRALLAQLGVPPSPALTFDELRRAVEPLRPFTLSAATDGNHGRAVAHVAAMLGFDANIYVPEDMIEARRNAIAAEGAAVTVVAGGYDDAVSRSAQDAGPQCLVISDTSWEGYEQIPGWVIDGYATVFAEIDEQLLQAGLPRPDVVVVPVGVGALAAATVRHFWSSPAPRPVLIGVEPTSAACVLESIVAGHIVTLDHSQHSVMSGLNCGTPSQVAWPLVSQGLDLYLAVPDHPIAEATRLLAADEIVAGESGAAGLAGLLTLQTDVDLLDGGAWLAPDQHVLLICTEGPTDPAAYARFIID
jgi:diaminopropionate ammonia-lyase